MKGAAPQAPVEADTSTATEWLLPGGLDDLEGVGRVALQVPDRQGVLRPHDALRDRVGASVPVLHGERGDGGPAERLGPREVRPRRGRRHAEAGDPFQQLRLVDHRVGRPGRDPIGGARRGVQVEVVEGEVREAVPIRQVLEAIAPLDESEDALEAHDGVGHVPLGVYGLNTRRGTRNPYRYASTCGGGTWS